MNYLYPDSVLLVFCKAPIPGRVKTRLMPDLNAEQAAFAHMELTAMTLDRAFEKALCPVRLYCAPDAEHQFFKRCADVYPLTLKVQNGTDLGLRMLNAFTEALEVYRHAVLIGCDCPSLTVSDLERAFEALRNGHDVVFAPAEDGGYVLVGLNSPEAILFENLVWGNESVMAETRRRAAEAKLKVYELATQWDVDEIDDWNRFWS